MAPTRIHSPVAPASAPPGRSAGAEALAALRPGQRVDARVLEVLSSGTARLALAGTEVLANGRVPLQPGQQLSLSVVRLEPVLELRVARPAAPPDPRAEVLRVALPRQAPLADTLRSAAEALRELPVPRDPRSALGELRSALGRLLDRAVPPERLDAAGVRRALASSGLFLEAGLAARGRPDAGDLKAALLGLAVRIGAAQGAAPAASTTAAAGTTAPATGPESAPGSEPRPGESGGAEGRTAEPRAPGPEAALERLARAVGAALARVQVHQAASLPSQEGGAVWQFDLPVASEGRRDAVEVRIARDGGGRRPEVADGGSAWSLTLHFDLPETGPVDVRLGLAGDAVAGTFWCSDPAARARFDAALPRLSEALGRAGLRVETLATAAGPAPAEERIPRPRTALVDARA
ncbi:MAG: flagellar hook-length control protein FliK [Pseudomonadales bacterium]|nr:flagellar hook-length control protein FliK [Pseudomonadales bacterium]